MAFSAGDAALLQQKLQEIERLSRLLGENINTINLQPIEVNAGLIEAVFERLNNKAAGLGEETDYLVSNFQKLVGEIKKSGTGINESTKALRSLGSITEKISSYQKGYSNLSSKEVAKLKNQVKIETDRLKIAKDTLKEEAINISQKIRNGNLTPKQLQIEQEKLAKIILARKNIKQLLQNEDITLGELNNRLKETEDETKRVEKALGLTGVVLKGISKIPILGDLVNTEEALKAAEKAAKDGAGRIGTLGAAIGSMGKSLISNLTDPLVLIGLLTTGFKKLVELGFAADKQIVALTKSMASSRGQAAALRQRFVEIQNGTIKIGGSLDNSLKTTKNLVDAQLELASAFGTGLGFTDQQVADQVYLTKQIRLSADEAAGLQQLAMANGKTADDIVNSTIKQTAALARQKGIQLDNKKVLGEVAKVSGQLRLQYQNNPDLIAKAVVQTQKLGVTLEQAANSSRHLLNFEESISDQIAAELLTGKELNLERARLLALNGDVAGSMQEMLSQIGSAAEFSQMNVVQQDALAKAVGMTSNELANSLVQQENLNRLGGAAKQQIEDKVKLLKAQGREQEAQQLMASLGNATDAKQALDKIDAQTKFNSAVERLQSMLGSIVEGPMAGFLDKMSAFLSDTDKVKQLFNAIKLTVEAIAIIIGVRMVAGLVSSIAKAVILLGLQTSTAAAATATNAAVTFGAGTVAVIASVAAILGALAATSVMKDGVVDYNRGPVVSGEFGSVQLSPKDTGFFDGKKIVAGTNLTGNNATSSPQVNINIDKLAKEQQTTNQLLSRLYNKDTNVYQDTYRVSIADNMGTYRI